MEVLGTVERGALAQSRPSMSSVAATLFYFGWYLLLLFGAIEVAGSLSIWRAIQAG